MTEKWFICSVKIKAENKEHVRDLLHSNESGLADALNIKDEEYIFEDVERVLSAIDEGIHKGDLPSKCPKCGNEDTIWEWETWEIYDNQHVNEATCPKCETVFNEIMEVTSWEFKNKEKIKK